MKPILSFVKRLCEPQPKSVPDPIDRLLIFRRNRTLFWIFFTVMLSAPFLVWFSGGAFRFCISVQAAHLTNLLIFLALCRSHLWAYHVFFVILMVIFPFIFMKVASHLAFIQIGHTLVLPMFVLLLTNNNFYAFIVVSVHIFTALFKTKPVLLENMEFMPPQDFINSVVNSGLAMSLGALLMFSINLASLNKRTREVMLANNATGELLEMQKTFLFSFSHEMRNPLNSLLGNLELVLMEKLPQNIREMVRTAQICSELLVQQINNVLDTGKHDLGHLEINLSQVKVYDMFMQVWALSNELIRRRNLKSIFKIEKNLPKILLLDSHRVNQVMMNLIGNALKFTERGSINIEVKWQEDSVLSDKSFEPIPFDTENEGLFEKDQCLSLLNNTYSYQQRSQESTEEGGGYVMLGKTRTEANIGGSSISPRRETKGVLKIVISDTGCGMTEESLKQLFQKFSQVSNDPNKRKMGTGLGLFITKEICTKMEADIRVYSKVGKGTAFIICIPTMSVSMKSPLSFQKNSAIMYNLISQRNLKCIVADDSPLNIAMVCNYFDKLNIKPVNTAINGEEAVSLYKQNRQAGNMIDVVTLDIDMPKMDGKAACQKIREYERMNRLTPAIIILISGNYAEEQIGINEKGANCFLKKPLKFEEFSSAVFRLIEPII